MRSLILLEQEVNAKHKGLPDEIGKTLVAMQNGNLDLYEGKKAVMESILEAIKGKHYINCPLCEEELKHYDQGGTHIYSCEGCSFLGLEYLNDSNIQALQTYLAHN